jgi:muramoyltetrapeptide carboxypeptidase LdcA involved in peptidoglycan recycling
LPENECMKTLIKPKALQKGDKVATISLSWGGAGELLHRYNQGKRQLQDTFDLEVGETTNALKSADYIYKNPKARADDLMEAFSDSSIKAIISIIGGDDSLRILPFIDLSVIIKNPKIFLGFSDSTVTHWACYKAGLTSFYGTSLLIGFAENTGMHQYQIDDIKRTLFSSQPVGQILPNLNGYTSERLEWADTELSKVKRKLVNSAGWNFLQGSGIVQGKLLGGCMDVLEFLKGTDLWVNSDDWQGAVLFIETSEVMPDPKYFRWWLRNYAAQGILHQLNGIIVGRPYDNRYADEYNKILTTVIRDEEGLSNLPIITEMDFGHTCPTFTLPMGVTAEIDSDQKTFSILENGVID